jgi:tetratricopeptide (TPR) repeat protein
LAQHRLGMALRTEGWLIETEEHRNEYASYCLQAQQAFREALRVRMPYPIDWADTQIELGYTLLELARAEGAQDSTQHGASYLDEGIEAYKEALTVLSPDRGRLLWIEAKKKLAIALRTKGWQLVNDHRDQEARARLHDAVDNAREVLSIMIPEIWPDKWADTQADIGYALYELGKLEGTAALCASLEAYASSLAKRPHATQPGKWAETQEGIGRTLWQLGVHADPSARYNEALDHFLAARLAYQEAHQDGPADNLTRNGIADLLKLTNRSDQAEPVHDIAVLSACP